MIRKKLSPICEANAGVDKFDFENLHVHEFIHDYESSTSKKNIDLLLRCISRNNGVRIQQEDINMLYSNNCCRNNYVLSVSIHSKNY